MTVNRISGARLYDGTGAAAVDGSVVLIEDEKISWVGAASDAPETGPGETLIDASGMSIMPGLIDSHVHLCAEPQRPPQFDPMGGW